MQQPALLEACPSTSKLSMYVLDLRSWMPQVCKSLRFSGVTVPRGYEAAFQRALWTFRHQRVYCASARALVPLRPLPAAGLASCAQVRRGAAWRRVASAKAVLGLLVSSCG